jgi:hypothetical protein
MTTHDNDMLVQWRNDMAKKNAQACLSLRTPEDTENPHLHPNDRL